MSDQNDDQQTSAQDLRALARIRLGKRPDKPPKPRAAPVDEPEQSRRFRFFPVFHFLRDNTAQLSHLEFHLAVIYLGFADKDTGIAFPSAELLAGLLGQGNAKNIAAIRNGLVRKGVIEVIESGGGRAKTCHIRMVMPPGKHLAPQGVSESGNPLPQKAKPLVAEDSLYIE